MFINHKLHKYFKITQKIIIKLYRVFVSLQIVLFSYNVSCHRLLDNDFQNNTVHEDLN